MESSYFPPITKEEAKGLKVFTKEEAEQLASIFNLPVFHKALRRANLAKPTDSLDKIKGWEKFERSLLATPDVESIEALEELEETYGVEPEPETE